MTGETNSSAGAQRSRAVAFARRLLRPLARVVRRVVAATGYLFPGGRKAYWESRARDVHEKYGRDTADNDVIRRVLARVEPKRVVDVGCGSGRLFPLYLEAGVPSILGLDVSEAALDLARAAHADPRIKLAATPVLATELAARSVDLCVSNRALQHIPGTEIGPTIARLCMWSGWVYLCEVSSDEISGDKSSFYIFAHDYAELFARNNFAVVDRGWIGATPWMLLKRGTRTS